MCGEHQAGALWCAWLEATTEAGPIARVYAVVQVLGRGPLESIYHPAQPHATPATVASAAIRCIHRRYGAAMDDRHVQQLIDRAIREHELRVALWSGLLGLLLMAGTWHAIWLCR